MRTGIRRISGRLPDLPARDRPLAAPRRGIRVLSHSRTFALSHCRKGFALLSVLWILVGISALALAANLAAREGVAAARNRADLARAAWHAQDCLERARAAIGDALLASRDEAPGAGVWGRMDREIAQSPLLAGAACTLEMRAAGSALDVNAAGDDAVRRLLLAIGRGEAEADSLVAALADWRDADDTPRPLGAERAWYAAAGMRPPRDGPIADPRELRFVRGFAAVPGIDTLLSAEPGRVAITHAGPAVLASLPGFGPEAAARALDMRMRGARVADLAVFVGSLSPGARDEAMRRFSDLVGMAVTEPEAWIVAARGSVGVPAAVSVVEVRLVRAGERAAIVRRRTWTE
jgi:type II secretory pathway component PulK